MLFCAVDYRGSSVWGSASERAPTEGGHPKFLLPLECSLFLWCPLCLVLLSGPGVSVLSGLPPLPLTSGARGLLDLDFPKLPDNRGCCLQLGSDVDFPIWETQT